MRDSFGEVSSAQAASALSDRRRAVRLWVHIKQENLLNIWLTLLLRSLFLIVAARLAPVRKPCFWMGAKGIVSPTQAYPRSRKKPSSQS